MADSGRSKQLLSQTIIYGLGIMLNRSVSFILIPIYTKFFSPSELGVFTLIQSLSIFLGFIYALGLETAFMKKFIDADSDNERREIYSSTIIFLLISSFLFSAVLYSLAPGISTALGIQNSAEGIYLIRLMSVVMIADTVYRIPMLYFRARLNAKTYSFLNLGSFLLNLLLNIVLIVFLGFGVEAIFYSYLVSVVVIMAAALIKTRDFLIPSLNYSKTKELLHYGFKFIFIGAFLLIIEMSDRFFLQHYFGESEVGIYSANYRLASVMGLVIAAFKFAWTPFFLNLNEESASKEIISSVTGNFVFAGSAMFLFFGLMIDLITPEKIFGINFIDPRYYSGLVIVPAILMSYFLSGLYSAFNAAPFFTGNTRSLFVISAIGVAVNIILNILLIPKYSMTGAAYATLLTYSLMFVLIFVYSQKIYVIKLNYPKLVVAFGLSLAMFSIGYFAVNRSGIRFEMKLLLDIVLIAVYLSAMKFSGILNTKNIRKLFRA